MNTALRGAALLAILVLAALPVWSSSYVVSFLINLFLYVAIAGGWNLFSGLTGYASLGHGLFFGIGAYAFAVSTVTLGLHPVAGFAVAAVLAGLVALALGRVLLSTRIPIAYFAIVMLGLNEIIKTVVAGTKALGSSYGLTLPPLPSNLVAYYFLLALALLTTALAFFIQRTPWGLGLRAILDDEVAAEVSGIGTVAHKMAMFVLSAVLLALAGGMIAWYWSYIDPYMAFDLTLSFEMVVMAVFGGIGTVFGPLLGAVVMCVAKELLQTSVPHLHTIVFGALVVALILWRPGGVMQLLAGLRRRREARA